MKILQWNARGLIVNGQKCKIFVHQLTVLPHYLYAGDLALSAIKFYHPCVQVG